MSPRLGADAQRHGKAVPGVVFRASHLGQIPSRAQIASAPFGVGLESAACQNYCAALDRACRTLDRDDYAGNARIVVCELPCPRTVADQDALLLRRFIQGTDQTRAAAPCGHNGASPKLEPSIEVVCRPTELRKETPPLLVKPMSRRVAVFDQNFAQVRISAVLRDPCHVVEELFFTVSAEIAPSHFV